MIVVVDYCKGNLQSVKSGLNYVGASAKISACVSDIEKASAIVLPGVGAFGDASKTMIESAQMQAIRSAISRGVPFLGICLGMHLMFAHGNEGASGKEDTDIYEGLGFLPGMVARLPKYDSADNFYKVPHIGWNKIAIEKEDCPLLSGIEDGEFFYFTHSFIAPSGAPAPSASTIATTTHSIKFPSIVQSAPAVFGVQFHPEKSSDAGMQLLKNFITLVKN